MPGLKKKTQKIVDFLRFPLSKKYGYASILAYLALASIKALRGGTS
jgi:hypothetical protein